METEKLFKAIVRCKDQKKARSQYSSLSVEQRRTFVAIYYKGLQVRHELRQHQYLNFPSIKLISGNWYITVYPKVGINCYGFDLKQEFKTKPSAEQILAAIKKELPTVKIL